MNKLVMASSVAFALGCGSGLAADLPVKGPYAPAASWTGCYLNGGVGYGLWTQDHFSETYPGLVATSTTITSGGRGWLGRVGAGCDYQVGGSYLVGVFGDYDFMNVHGTFSDPASTDIGNENERGSWAVGARVGYLVTPSILSYANGGYAQARFDTITLSTNAVVPVATGTEILAQTYHGWFIGGGTEVALRWLPGLFWRSEYRFATYQAADLPIVTIATGAATGAAVHSEKDVQTITSGLVWRFNFGGPIATRY